MKKINTPSLIRIIDISLLIWILAYGAIETVEALINLGISNTAPCQSFACDGRLGLVAVKIPRLFYQIPLCLISYAGLVIIFFKHWLPSWIFVIVSVLFLALLHNYNNYGMGNLVYLFVPYLVFRAIFIHQGQTWRGTTLRLIAKAALESYIRILLFVTLLVSVAMLFPPLIDRAFIEIIDCKEILLDCGDRRLIYNTNLYQVLYLLPIIVLSFIGLYINERRSTSKYREKRGSTTGKKRENG